MKIPISFLVVAILMTITAAAQDTTHKDIVGTYHFPGGSVVEQVVVTQENGSFTMNSTAGASPLEYIKGDSFSVVNFSGIAVFKRNAQKKINAIHIDAAGYVLDGVKDSTGLTIHTIDMKPGSNFEINSETDPATSPEMVAILYQLKSRQFRKQFSLGAIVP